MFLVMHNWTVHTHGSGEPYGNQISRKKNHSDIFRAFTKDLQERYF